MTSREGITRSEPLSSTVYRHLIGRLRAGELNPGSRLREDDVAASLGVSRTPVREAFARLQARGLVTATPIGLVVTELTQRQIQDLYAMRAIVEGAAARLAAENASAADLAAIRHAGENFDRIANSADEYARANRLFHESIYQAARNDYLMRTVEDLNDSLALLPRTTFMIEGRSVEAKQEHAQITAAIAARDADAAEVAARKHIERALEGRLRLQFSF
jgi:DNA-binding GntR family transcriptional regulator